MKNFLISLLVLCALVAIKIWNPYPVQILELKSIDYTLRSKEITTNQDIVIIDVSDKTLEKLGQWPIDRIEFADMIERLRHYQAGVIVFPILFSEPDRSGHDNEFAKSVASGGIVLAQVPTNQSNKPDAVRRGFAAIGGDPSVYAYTWNGAVSPLQAFADAASGVGVIASTPEVDGVIRRMPMVVNIAGQLYPSLPLEIIRTLTDDPSFQIKTGEAGIEAVRIPQFKTINTDAHARIWLDPSSRFEHVDFLDVKREDVEGKLVILGVTASGVSTIVATPHGEQFVQDLQAQALLSVFAGTTPERIAIAPTVELLAFALLGLLIILVVTRLKVTWTVPVYLILFLGIAYTQSYLFTTYNQLWDSSYILLAGSIIYFMIVAQKMISEYMQNLQIKKQFGSYVNPTIVEMLQKDPSLIRLGGEKRDLSIVMTDLRGFTSLGESYGEDVEGLTSIMNDYMTALSIPVLKNNGTLIKFIGDASLHIHGAPIKDDNHAKVAVQTALEMIEAIKQFNTELTAKGRPPVGMGAGVNTGPTLVGNIGSKEKFGYDVLGDSVSTAARLEGQTKGYGVLLIIGPETNKLVEDEYVTLELDCIAVKGKTIGLNIYTVLGRHKELIEKVNYVASVEAHNKMLTLYRQKNFDMAIRFCEDLKGSFNGVMDHYYDIWIERCNEMKTKNLPKDWDGIYRATTK